MPWTVDDIVKATGGKVAAGDRAQRFEGLSIDSRTITPQEAFVAIRGETHDGHGFVADAIRRRARGLVLNRSRFDDLVAAIRAGGDVAAIVVDDTTRALGDLGAFHRRRSRAEIIAITGSNGKTSTRRMAAAVVAQRHAVLEPVKNLNNQIGVPLTLFRLDAQHDWAVLELGTNMPGEIARLAEICSPDIGVITNIGPAHLEGLGSLEGVMREKGALISGLKAGGRVALNADDVHLQRLARELGPPALWFGLGPEADVRAESIRETRAGIDFQLVLPESRTGVHLNTHGRFMVSNALAAAAVGRLIGLGGAEVCAGLEKFTPVSGRLQVVDLPGGIHLIDDSYNANPASVEGAIGTLCRLSAGARSLLAFSDMRELGPDAAARHRDMGRLAAKSGIDRLLVCGEFAAEVALGAREAGMPASGIQVGSRAQIRDALIQELTAGDWLLVKGSRAMGMEAVVEAVIRHCQKGA